MDAIGRVIQGAIYRAGALGRRPVVPVSPGALEAAARKAMSPEAFAYVAGSAGLESTDRANRDAFDAWRIVPRMLVDVSSRSQAVTLSAARTRHRCWWHLSAYRRWRIRRRTWPRRERPRPSTSR